MKKVAAEANVPRDTTLCFQPRRVLATFFATKTRNHEEAFLFVLKNGITYCDPTVLVYWTFPPTIVYSTCADGI